MAAGLMRQHLAIAGLDGQVQVQSAGIWAIAGRPASQEAIQVMAERGIDISSHRTRELDMTDVAQADLILVMEEAHRRSIFHLAPQHLHKVFLLSEMAGKHHDIEDPYGQSLAEYRCCAEELDSLLKAGFTRILRRLRLIPQSPSF